MNRERDFIDVATPALFRRKQRRSALLAHVAKIHGVTVAEIMAPTHHIGARVPKVAHARFHAMALMQTRFGDSLSQIGRFFGRDHTTVMHGIVRWRELEVVA
jgi:chromosomal replication initiation ATPase DnaA